MGKKSASAAPRPARAVEFANASGFAGFLLTCFEEPGVGQTSVIYENFLNKVFIRVDSPHTLHVRVTADRDVLVPLLQMAIANGGVVRQLGEMDEKYLRTDIPGLLKRIQLKPAVTRAEETQTCLLALWNADNQLLRDTLLRLSEMSAAECEVAFLRRENPLHPTHLIMVHNASHVASVVNWVKEQRKQAELFVPYSAGTGSRFFVHSGFSYPLPGLDRLCDTGSELVLLRHDHETNRTAWLAFAPGQLNFFRKFHDVFDVSVDLKDVPMLALEEELRAERLPLEIAFAPDEGEGGPLRLWQLDKVIDRERQQLADLEKRRQRMALGKNYDAYLVYKFHQRGPDRLNALLARFLQQRLSSLAYYEYAYCDTGQDTPFHLVIAQRLQRDMGFGIQLADEIYQQPEEFRRWGVNLYLPVGRQLLPAISSADAIPLLHQLLEKTDAHNAGAVLWNDLGHGRIAETKVMETQPLLSQFQLLNSFQRDEARSVAESTRRSLAAALVEARHSIGLTCRDLETDIVAYLDNRCEQIEETYRELHDVIAGADADLIKREPQIAKVASFIRSLPKRWAIFLQAVLDLHRQLSAMRIEAHGALQVEYRVSRETLESLAKRHKDLSEGIAAYEEKVTGDRERLEGSVSEAKRMLDAARAMHGQLYGLYLEIRSAFQKLEERLAAIAVAQRRADRIQQRIDSVDDQERRVQDRLKQLEAVKDEIRDREAKLSKNLATADAKEADAAMKLAEVGQAEEDMIERVRKASRQLRQLEEGLNRIASEREEADALFHAIEEEAQLLDKRASVVERWQKHSAQWSAYLRDEYTRLDEEARKAHEHGRV